MEERGWGSRVHPGARWLRSPSPALPQLLQHHPAFTPESLPSGAQLKLEGVLPARICKAITLKNQQLLLRLMILFQELNWLLLVSAQATFLRRN